MGHGGIDGHKLEALGPIAAEAFQNAEQLDGRNVIAGGDGWDEKVWVRLADVDGNGFVVFRIREEKGEVFLDQAQSETRRPDGEVLVDGLPRGRGPGKRLMHPVGHVSRLPDGQAATGPQGPLEFFRTL